MPESEWEEWERRAREWVRKVGEELDRRDRRDRKRAYRRYMNSDVWWRKRKLVLKRDKHRCWECKGKATQVHHLMYPERFGDEPLRWLVSVCKRCHREEHGIVDWEEPPLDHLLLDYLLEHRLAERVDHDDPDDLGGDFDHHEVFDFDPRRDSDFDEDFGFNRVLNF